MKRTDEVWDPCPEGEIRRLAGALRQAQSRQTAGLIMIVVAVLVTTATLFGVIQAM